MTTPIDRCNDGSRRPPRLRRDINLGTLAELPRGSTGWRATHAEQVALLKADGHEAARLSRIAGECFEAARAAVAAT